MKKIREAIGDFEGWIRPVSKFSFRNTSNSFCSAGDKLVGFDPGINSMAWSHSLGCGRTSKDSLENTEVNSWRYSGIRAEASELVQKASASRCEMEEVALMSIEGEGNRPVARIQSPSSKDGTSEESERLEGSVSEFESWWTEGMGPLEQASVHRISAFCV